MTARRKAKDDGGSLELLLDTICNTFGGILFISLLVAILLNTTSEQVQTSQPSQMSQLELIESELQRQELTNELTRLQLAVGQLDVNSQAIVTPEVVDLANKLHQAQQSHTDAVTENSQTQESLNKSQMEINKIVTEAEQRDEKIEAARKRAAALEDRLKESIAQRSGEAVIPKVVKMDLRQVLYVLHNGKLYGPWQNSPDLASKNIAGGKIQIDIVANSGVSIDAQGQTDAFKHKFVGHVSPSRHQAVICVFADSFEHWTIVRRCLSELQLKYDLMPFEDNQQMIFVEGAGNNSVQG